MISMKNVSKVYVRDKPPALTQIDVEIAQGEFVFLVGHSGSGKSTFIRLLLRELIPTTGRIVVAGQDVLAMKNWKIPYLRRNIGCVFQDFKLLPNKTAYENVAYALEVIGKSRHVVAHAGARGAAARRARGQDRSPTRTSSPAASSSASRSREPSSTARRCCSRTSRPATSTPPRRSAS